MAGMGVKRRVRIHGDNIVECERALRLISAAIGTTPRFMAGPLFAPKYLLASSEVGTIEVQLFPGYGRWGFNIVSALADAGAPLPEAADAVVSEVATDSNGEQTELLLLAIEFCGALPAGNNAWQRCGRSYSYAITGLPYLYFSELGGYELTSTRGLKSARMPNPLVPVAYVRQADLSDTFALPVYEPSPTIDDRNKRQFGKYFGLEDAYLLIRAVFTGGSSDTARKQLANKGIGIAGEILKGSHRGPSVAQWQQAAPLRGLELVRYWASQRLAWSKSISMDITPTMRMLNQFLSQFAYGLGSSDMPFAVVPNNNRTAFAAALARIYPGLVPELLSWINDDSEPLIVTMIAGFKPRGDDSRPDRGLLPLIRMLFGERVQILSIIYGPAKTNAWSKLISNRGQLAKENGLWNSVLSLSDAVLADSKTLTKPIAFVNERQLPNSDLVDISLPAARDTPAFGEQDVDTVIRFLYATNPAQVFEGMCNPPGGDWSGVSLISGDRETEARWTSLPRVSSHGGKRPDHVVQFFNDNGPDEILSIESKRRYQNLEPNVGNNLNSYILDLLGHPATISRKVAEREWAHNSVEYNDDYALFSAGAFIGQSSGQIAERVAVQFGFDLVIAVDFEETPTSILLAHNAKAARIAKLMIEQSSGFAGWLKVEVHAF